jgi:hypothetical protein
MPAFRGRGVAWLHHSLPCDVTVRDGVLSWDWDHPALTIEAHPRSPVSFHVPAQVAGTPFFDPEVAIVKFNSFWTIELEPGYSLFATHPVNRADRRSAGFPAPAFCRGSRPASPSPCPVESAQGRERCGHGWRRQSRATLFSRASLDRDPHVRGRPPLGASIIPAGESISAEPSVGQRLRGPRDRECARRWSEAATLYLRRRRLPPARRRLESVSPSNSLALDRAFRKQIESGTSAALPRRSPSICRLNHARMSGARRPRRPDSSLAPFRPL